MDRKAKFEELKQKRRQGQTENRKILQTNSTEKEGQESLKQKRKREEAEDLLLQQEEKSERLTNLKYSIEDQERWNQKLAEKDQKLDKGFTDFTQIGAKKYQKMIKEFKPDLKLYNIQKTTVNDFYRDQNSLEYGSSSQKPTKEAMDRLVQELDKQVIKRGKFSKRRAFNESEDVTYINERNMRFNKKVNRAYDKFTTEIKANLERGTAL
jgi:pre-mRNA-splicing factor SYF2